jgi:hypothetical protein
MPNRAHLPNYGLVRGHDDASVLCRSSIEYLMIGRHLIILLYYFVVLISILQPILGQILLFRPVLSGLPGDRLSISHPYYVDQGKS